MEAIIFHPEKKNGIVVRVWKGIHGIRALTQCNGKRDLIATREAGFAKNLAHDATSGKK